MYTEPFVWPPRQPQIYLSIFDAPWVPWEYFETYRLKYLAKLVSPIALGGGIEGKLEFHFTFGQFCFSQGKQLVCPPVQVPHCGLAVARMGGLKQAGRPPSAQNRWLFPQPATRAWVSNQSWDINRCLLKTTKRLQNPKPIATETQIMLNIASFTLRNPAGGAR